MLLIALAVCIAGLVLFVLAEKTKPSRVGEIMFAVGLFWVLALGGKAGLPF